MDMRRGAAVPAAPRDSAGPPGKRFFADAEPRAAGRCRPCGAERFGRSAGGTVFRWCRTASGGTLLPLRRW